MGCLVGTLPGAVPVERRCRCLLRWPEIVVEIGVACRSRQYAEPTAAPPEHATTRLILVRY